MDEVRDEIPEASSRPSSIRVKRLAQLFEIPVPVPVPVIPVTEIPVTEIPVIPVTEIPVTEIPVTEIPVIPVPVPVGMNEINVEKTVIIKLINFDIISILLIPKKSATVKLVINTSAGPLERTYHVKGKEYTDWESDDSYIFYLIQANIDKIYES